MCNGPLLDAIASEAINSIREFSPQELANLAWACAALGFCDLPLISAISSEAMPTLSSFMPQDLSCIAWSFSSSGILDAPLLSAIASAARTRLNDFDAQSLGNIAWAFDVLLDRAHLNGYLAAACKRYCTIATPTPETSGMSWVEFQSIMSDYEGEDAQMILRRFNEEVGQPVMELLRDIASSQHAEHNVAMDAIAEYAPKHMLPHLGLPFTRDALQSLGVVFSNSKPSEAIRAECWRAGMS